eukprot:GHUV01022680.1.p1 GENE.GHUV01022680.1~~GHUV01022680.1.p1  ORF type:complete len:240 (-),score=100.71 GHUV01022680.1:93-812(-)
MMKLLCVLICACCCGLAVSIQVTFRANRLVIGDERFDQEFKVDLIATMSSKVTQQAVLLQQDSADAAAAAVAVTTGNGAVTNGSGTSLSSSSGEGRGPEIGTVPQKQQWQGADGAAADEQLAQQHLGTTAAAAATAGSVAAEEPQQRVWQRGSSLGCKVRLSMTLRLPHPLSIVPGPLLSTAAGLIAKLVMQALLPSFLELLATDYGRWASGSSTATRQATPAGSLVTAGKQQLQQLQQ